MRSRAGISLGLLVQALSCAAPPLELAQHGDPLEAAIADLSAAGFEFAADVRLRSDALQSCDGLACAHLVMERQRRTILLAPEAFESGARLRATLLEIWERYPIPRPPSYRDSARGALRVLQDGPRVGVDDLHLLRRAHHIYRQHYSQLSKSERARLPHPDTLAFP